MRQLVFSLIRVRRGAAGASRGVLLAGGTRHPGGARPRRHRGRQARGRRRDAARTVSARFACGGAPIGCRGRAPACRCGASIAALAWCEDPADRRYNRPFRRSANEPGDRLWRDDHLYDLVIEISPQHAPAGRRPRQRRVRARGAARPFRHRRLRGARREGLAAPAGPAGAEHADRYWAVGRQPRTGRPLRCAHRATRAPRKWRCRPAHGWPRR